MFLHRSVILSTGGGVYPSMHLGRHPPRVDTPWADIPRADTPLLGRHPAQQTATAADGSHRTGMHSCLTSDHFPLGGAEFDPVVLCANKLFNVYHK